MKAKHKKQSSSKGTVLKTKIGIAFALGVFCVVFTALMGCSAQAEGDTSSNDPSSSEVSTEINIDEMDLDYTKRDKDASYNESIATHIVLTESSAAVSGEGAAVEGSTVTVSQAGTYVISGSLDEGQLIVDASDEDKVQLVLAGVTIHNEEGPAIYIKNADKTFVTLAEGSTNTLSDGSEYVLEENSDEPYATLFSKDDLTINGTGTLVIQGNYRHGICSKDDLVITGGNIQVTASEDALRGRDCVKILDGTFNLESGQDAIKSNNDEDGTKGFVSVDGGTFTINAGDDAVHAESVLFVNNGTVNVEACYEGYEAEQIYINGANTHIVASDDALNAAARNSSQGDTHAMEEGVLDTRRGNQADAGRAGASGGTVGGTAPSASAGDDVKGVDGDSMQGGAMNGNNFSSTTTIPQNVQPGEPGGAAPNNSANTEAQGGMNEAPEAGNDASCLIQINGGYTVLDASGDGVDSNGSVEITGGVLLVSGPTSDGDGAFDYDKSATISGGTVIMVGSSGMAQSFTSGTQAFAFANVSGKAGDSLAICDNEGNVIASFTASKSFATVLVSCPSFTEGSEYSLAMGGTVSESNSDGYATSGLVSGGTESTISALTTSSSGMGGSRKS